MRIYFLGGLTVKSYETLTIDVIAVADATIASAPTDGPTAFGDGTGAFDFYLKDEGLGN